MEAVSGNLHILTCCLLQVPPTSGAFVIFTELAFLQKSNQNNLTLSSVNPRPEKFGRICRRANTNCNIAILFIKADVNVIERRLDMNRTDIMLGLAKIRSNIH